MSSAIPNGRILAWLPVGVLLVGFGIGWGQMTSAAEDTKENAAKIEKQADALIEFGRNQVKIQTKLEALITAQSESSKAITKSLAEVLRAVQPTARPQQ